MAFANRGSSPSSGGSGGGSSSSGSRHHHHHHHSHYYHHWGYYSLYCLIIEILFLVSIVFIYIYTYEVTVVDPLAKIKSIFLTVQMYVAVLSIIFIIISNWFRENTAKLIKGLKYTILFSFLSLSLLIGGKAYLDNTYDNKAKFEELYDIEVSRQEEFLNENDEIFEDIVEIDSKSTFVYQNLKGYTFFTVKVFVNFIVQLLIMGFEFCLLVINVKKKRKEDMIAKENEVLFDEEQNVKI